MGEGVALRGGEIGPLKTKVGYRADEIGMEDSMKSELKSQEQSNARYLS